MDRKKTILIVDDEEDLREAISFDLNHQGYEVLLAENGVQAFEIIEKKNPDLVVTDVRMPGGDGIELLKKIRARNSLHPVVILATGYADLSVAEAYHLGAEAIFSKPFDRKKFHESIRWLLKPVESRWAGRPMRLEVDLMVGINFEETDQKVEAVVKNIGQGGMFVSFGDVLPQKEEKCSFLLNTQMEDVPQIKGNGVVRWVKKQSDNKEGCGIQFSFHDEQGENQILEFLNYLKTKSFIPIF